MPIYSVSLKPSDVRTPSSPRISSDARAISPISAPEEGYAPPTPKMMIAPGLNRVIRSAAACAAFTLPMPPAQSTASRPESLPRIKILDPRVRDSSVVMEARRSFDSMGTAQRSAIIKRYRCLDDQDHGAVLKHAAHERFFVAAN